MGDDKPITMMLDRCCMGERTLQDYLWTTKHAFTHAKIGWGIAGLVPALWSRVNRYRAEGIAVFCGGTRFEHAVVNVAVDDYLAGLQKAEITWIEVSDGVIDLAHALKVNWIRHFVSLGFQVASEVGRKFEPNPYSPAEWHDRAAAELEAGAEFVICEGRESGNIGIYDEAGQPLERILDALEPLADKLVFEAPKKDQQVALMKRFGPNVGLGNIPITHTMNVLSMRHGLRADTLGNPGDQRP